MSYGYLGDTSTKIKQVRKNDGIISVSDAFELEAQGKYGTALELLDTQTGSTNQNLNFTDIKESEYDIHFMTATNHTFPAGNQNYGLRLYEDGVGLETASVYSWCAYYNQGGGNGDHQTATADYMRIENTGSEQFVVNWYAYLFNLGDSSAYSSMSFNKFPERITTGGSYAYSGTAVEFGAAVLEQTSKITQIQVYNSSQTASAGTVKLYGVKQS